MAIVEGTLFNMNMNKESKKNDTEKGDNNLSFFNVSEVDSTNRVDVLTDWWYQLLGTRFPNGIAPEIMQFNLKDEFIKISENGNFDNEYVDGGTGFKVHNPNENLLSNIKLVKAAKEIVDMFGEQKSLMIMRLLHDKDWTAVIEIIIKSGALKEFAA